MLSITPKNHYLIRSSHSSWVPNLIGTNNANHLKEILVANRDCTNAHLKVSEAGLASVEFVCGDIKFLTTKPEVLHAETNAIAKLAKSTESGSGASLFVTHAPCLDCAKLVYQSGINSVFYRNAYRSQDGLNFLEKAGVKVEKI